MIIRIEENDDLQFIGPKNVFNKIREENFPKLKKEMAIKYKKPIEYQINGTRKTNPPSHNCQSIKGTKQRKNTSKNFKGKGPSNIQRKTYLNYTRFLNRDYESQKRLV